MSSKKQSRQTSGKISAYVRIVSLIFAAMGAVISAAISIFPRISDFVDQNSRILSVVSPNTLFILIMVLIATTSVAVVTLFANLTKALGFESESEKHFTASKEMVLREDLERDVDVEISEEIAKDFNSLKPQRPFKNGDPLKAIELAKSRLSDHIAKLRNNSILNLFISVGFASFGMIILASAYWEIEKYRDMTSMSLKLSEFVTIVLVPRVSIALFIQIFS